MSGRKAKFLLPPESTVAEIEQIQSRLPKLCAGKNDVVFDIQRVKSIDTAVLQLLYLVKKELLAAGRSVEWTTTPEGFLQAAALAGFHDLLEPA